MLPICRDDSACASCWPGLCVRRVFECLMCNLSVHSVKGGEGGGEGGSEGGRRGV